jgi:hypothetical protein
MEKKNGTNNICRRMAGIGALSEQIRTRRMGNNLRPLKELFARVERWEKYQHKMTGGLYRNIRGDGVSKQQP